MGSTKENTVPTEDSIQHYQNKYKIYRKYAFCLQYII